MLSFCQAECEEIHYGECADSRYHRMPLHLILQHQGCALTDALRVMSVDDLAQLYLNVTIDLLNRHCPVDQSSRFDAAADPWHMHGLTLSVVLPGSVPEPLREDSEGCGDFLAPKWDWKSS